ncbi:MAG: haloacid dehalogenase [Sphingomonas bacterium]|uniref:HAD-IIIC family phosphatase n=1 Tax=Sphingomonas bacterium TaxID=1895847 RepID=UPI0026189CF4|nr:HAD-IIIC family phosphatase [Sphingomonas bacterium]MDB5711462.1 haloacid dehalogenase [Sphingomonas bacterium]
MSFHADPATLFWLPEAGPRWSDRLRQSLVDDPSGRLLRGTCSCQLSTSQLRTAKAAIAAHERGGGALTALRAVRLGLVGAGTLDFLADTLPGTAPRFGLKIDVAPTHYNSIASAAFADPGFDGAVDAVVIMPDAESFKLPGALLDREAHDQAVADALAHLQRIVDALRGRHGCAIVLATVPPRAERIAGTGDRALLGSYGRFVDDLNRGIVDYCAAGSATLWDLDAIAAAIGSRQWRDPVAMHVAKSLFSINLAPLVADRLCATLAPIFGKSRRGLVLDLDNTLWGGVIGDDGLAGINIGQGDAVGEAHLSLQRLALELRRRGVVLTVCSKNDDAVARGPFREHPDMLLREEHFAVFQANWSDKATNLKTIADELALNPDALVFVDDNPAERARVRQQFPEVAVPELPDDPALYASCLAAAGYFEMASLGADDLNRAEAYQNNARRAEIRKTIGDYDQYLQSLDMTLTVSAFDAVGRSRIAQLTNKSNQFNLTTIRRHEDDIRQVEESASHFGLQFRLVDSFGDNGMICVVVLEKKGDTVEIDTWLMSCRVLERGVEQAVLNEILAIASRLGATTVTGRYIPTERNAMVRDHYARLGFEATDDAAAPDGVTWWRIAVENFVPGTVQMQIERRNLP